MMVFVQGSGYNNAQNNTLNIDTSNHRGSSGKSLTYWSEVQDALWATSGLLNLKLNPAGYSELYIRFYIKFQTGWKWRNTGQEPMQKFFKSYTLGWNRSLLGFFSTSSNKNELY